MNDDEDFWQNRFHLCALAAGFIAVSEGRVSESRYVQQLAYELYERGAFRGGTANSLTTAANCPIAEAFLTSRLEPHAAQAEEDQTD
jgi:hypothetical protein